ncbi:hypothetical protein ACFO3J_18380 [Streptomyces polygonati]|uniref:Aminoglycoside phosphotransferase domain-containing protein n=1 Tax=Streptomyces polygonati TaxID=1617087 RepID=A0ABV8HQS2_9ACTN
MPQPLQYAAALANPRTALSDPELRRSRPVLGARDRPEQRIGQHAFVYRLDHPDGRRFAVRCFLDPGSADDARYLEIGRYLAGAALPEICGWQWQAHGITVDGQRLPILVGPWADDQPLHEAVSRHHHDAAWLLTTAERWRDLVRRMAAAKVAHGDLQHGNVLVGDRSFTLIDPDGIWTPTLARLRPPAEAGHPNYQHPLATVRHWGAKGDRFAAHVIYLSLRALAVAPELWDRYHDEHNLIFVADDYAAPGTTAVWQDLARSPDPLVRALAGRLAAMCGRSPRAVTTLEASVKSATPRTWAAPRWWRPTTGVPGVPVAVVWLIGLAVLAVYLSRNLFADRLPGQPAEPVTAAAAWSVAFVGILAWSYARLPLAGVAGGAAAAYIALDLPRLVTLVADEAGPRLIPTLTAAVLALALAVVAAVALRPVTAPGPATRAATHLYLVGVLSVALGQAAALGWPSADAGRIERSAPSIAAAAVGVSLLAAWLPVARRSAGWLVGAAAVLVTRSVAAAHPLSWPALPDPWDTAVPVVHLAGVAVLVAAACAVGIGRWRTA